MARDGVFEALGRINLIGEHTDYNDGFVLPVALPHSVRVTASRRDDGVLRVASKQAAGVTEVRVTDLAPGAVTGWAAYAAGVVWALRAAGHPVGGFDLLVDGNVPRGAGLSSSAALESAVALAVTELSGVALDRRELARVARRAENDFVGVPCGVMDQSASLLAWERHALLLDTRTLAVEHIPFDPAAAGLALLVVDTRAPHRLVDGEYAARRRDCHRAAELLGVAALRDLVGEHWDLPEKLERRVRHVVGENARVLAVADLLRAGRLREVGPLLTASHESLRDDYEVTVPELDVAVDALLHEGALGARMTGGGFGGCVIALVEQDAVDAAAAAVRSAFAGNGFTAPECWTATAAGGAHRVDPAG
ncbi:galactokinase [Saccharothrix syringae]|uniref:Galactokinase n=1 Tax=Saccharothrix syringae TaxID=103733 RepID=A0A5Q0GX97_SACSY|nr:galactokinase [Saccharothrix syringae]QFZ18164.1 galactokinase [Saccharothrix syringae]